VLFLRNCDSWEIHPRIVEVTESQILQTGRGLELDLGSWAEYDGCGEGGEEALGALVVLGGQPAIVLQVGKHDLFMERRLSCLTGSPRGFWPGMQGRISLSFYASLNQSAS
jgi:hypothetical protein